MSLGRIGRIGVAVIGACILSNLASAADKPNVVVIVGDDMGYADIGAHGCRDIPTPHLDALAAAGVHCTNGYVSGTYCSPTRAGLLTGRYQTRFGHEFNPGPGPADDKSEDYTGAGLPVSETTMADRLKAAGYATGLVGKWHLGFEEHFHPLRRGFDEFFGFIAGAHGYFPGKGAPILRGEEPVEENEYLTDAFEREAVAFLDRQNSEKPFFLCVTFNAVHTPMHADDARLEKFKHIEDKQRRTYAAMMSAMDDAIGAVMAKLHEKGFDENTLVFFISDNGGPTISTTTVNGAINSPLRGSKRTTLEGGIRVPFLAKWTGTLPAGKVYEEPVIQLDILPTVLAAAGSEAGDQAPLEGVDLLPYFQNKNEGSPHEALYWRFGPQMAIRQGDWKLVRYDPKVDEEPGKVTDAMLYDLANDIGETRNLIDAEPEKAKGLQAAWDKWNESNVAAAWGGDSKRDKAKRNKARKQRRQTAA
jgi:arylsulfatase A-like enzyme